MASLSARRIGVGDGAGRACGVEVPVVAAATAAAGWPGGTAADPSLDGPRAASGDGAGTGAGAPTSPLPSSPARQSANRPSSLSPTSTMTPRPNCAGLPVIARSVVTLTLVEDPPSSCSCAVIVALAVPLPRASLALASITARRADSSFSLNRAVPAYVTWIGPTFTFTLPTIVSPSNDSTVAPGMHGAMRSTSSSTSQACATGTGTLNSCSSCIAVSLAAGGSGHGAPGQHPREVLAVVGLAVQVARRAGALGGPLGGGSRSRPARRRRAPPPPPLARTGVAPMLDSAMRASAMEPLSRRTAAATATIAHACATRVNFSYR